MSAAPTTQHVQSTTITVQSKRFAGYNVIVTGGASGIGLATVVEFLKDGAAAVAIMDYNEQEGKRIEAEFKAQGCDAPFYRGQWDETLHFEGR
jgi:NAD(P)-dependent dehydrogenase (short-subunit alcohol dehydrogenase family)